MPVTSRWVVTRSAPAAPCSPAPQSCSEEPEPCFWWDDPLKRALWLDKGVLGGIVCQGSLLLLRFPRDEERGVGH